MNEATKQALEQFVTKMLAAAEQGAGWSAEQAPLLVQEWLRWQLVDALIVVVASALVIGAAVVSGKKALAGLRGEATREDRLRHGYDDSDPLPYVLWLVFGAIAPCALGLLMFLASASTAVKVTIAPRVVVLEKFAELVR